MKIKTLILKGGVRGYVVKDFELYKTISGTTLSSDITFNIGQFKVAMYKSMHVHMLYILNIYGLACACLGMYMFFIVLLTLFYIMYVVHCTKAI